MKVYAEATCDGDVIKKGEAFPIISENSTMFDFGGRLKGNCARWEGSAHLNGGNWKRIEINEDEMNNTIELTNGCYTNISHLSVEDQKRVLKYYKSFGVEYLCLYEDDNDFLDGVPTWPCLSWLSEEGRLSMLCEDDINRKSAKHIPAEDILKSLPPEDEESVPTLLEQIKQAKIAYDEAEEHLQSLLNKGHEELGDCGITLRKSTSI